MEKFPEYMMCSTMNVHAVEYGTVPRCSVIYIQCILTVAARVTIVTRIACTNEVIPTERACAIHSTRVVGTCICEVMCSTIQYVCH